MPEAGDRRGVYTETKGMAMKQTIVLAENTYLRGKVERKKENGMDRAERNG